MWEAMAAGDEGGGERRVVRLRRGVTMLVEWLWSGARGGKWHCCGGERR